MSAEVALTPSPEDPAALAAIAAGRTFVDRMWVLADEPHDRVPIKFEGNPIPPNKYCRAWNSKEMRQKYCRNPAGRGTDHPGVGRCKQHFGNVPVTHGMRSRYRIGKKSLSERFHRHANDPQLLDMRNEIAVLAALLDEALDSEMIDRDICTRLAEAVSKAKDRLHANASKQAFSVDQMKRFWANQSRTIEFVLKDHPELLARLLDALRQVPI